MASLFDLPPELLNRVLDFTDPGTHFNLALSSKLALRRLQDTIEYHKKCYRLQVVTDILPSTIPELLNGGKPDTAALWHVRTIELWSSRSSWANWKVHELVYPDDTPEHRRLRDHAVPERPYGTGHFTQDELDNFMAIMERNMHFDHSTAWKWRSSIEEGCDLALKGILVALCPRLQNLRLIYDDLELSTAETSQDSNEDENDNDDDDINYISKSLFHGLIDPEEDHTEITCPPKSHELFLRFIGKCIRLSASPGSDCTCPPGFASLQHVAVGVNSQGHQKEVNDEWLNASATAPLFGLPSIKSLYLAGLALHDENRASDVEDGVAEDSNDPMLTHSSVERLFIDRSTPSDKTLIRFLWACKGLRSLAFQHCNLREFELDSLQEGMDEHNREGTLQYFSMMACEARGYRSELPDAYDFWPLSTVALGDLYADGSINEKERPTPGVMYDFKDRLRTVFEEHHGYISIQAPMYWRCSPEVDEMELLDDAFTDMLRTAEQISFKGIFLDNLEHPRSDKFCFRKTIMAGKSRGVEIITAATPISDELQAMVPRGETDADIESSPWRKHASFKHMVAHHSHGVEKAGCKSCGQCKVCYGMYPKELWDQRNRGEYFTKENLKKWRKEDRAIGIAAGYLEGSEDGDDDGEDNDGDSDADSWDEMSDSEDSDEESCEGSSDQEEEAKDSGEEEDDEVRSQDLGEH